MDENLKFTDETLKLAAFKLLAQNNAMLRALISNQARMLAVFANAPHFYDNPEVVEIDREIYEKVIKEYTAEAENLSIRESWEWAATNNPEMDAIIKNLF